MEEIYTMTKNTMSWGIAAAAIIAGLKIFTKWNRGEEVLPLILGWLFGLVVASFLFVGVDEFIKGGASNLYTTSGAAEGLAIESYEAGLMIGVAISILSVIRIYRKYNDGEEVHGAILSWFGSLIFLFVFSYIIEAIL